MPNNTFADIAKSGDGNLTANKSRHCATETCQKNSFASLS